jgi:hypothetical protein
MRNNRHRAKIINNACLFGFVGLAGFALPRSAYSQTTYAVGDGTQVATGGFDAYGNGQSVTAISQPTGSDTSNPSASATGTGGDATPPYTSNGFTIAGGGYATVGAEAYSTSDTAANATATANGGWGGEATFDGVVPLQASGNGGNVDGTAYASSPGGGTQPSATGVPYFKRRRGWWK